MRRHQIDPSDLWDGTYDDRDSSVMRPDGAKRMLEVAFRHPIKMFVNALGVPPAEIIEEAHSRGMLVGALTGSRRHAIKHAEAGVDVLSNYRLLMKHDPEREDSVIEAAEQLVAVAKKELRLS